MYLHSTILQMYAKTPLLDFIFWSHGVVGGWLWNVLYTLHYTYPIVCSHRVLKEKLDEVKCTGLVFLCMEGNKSMVACQAWTTRPGNVWPELQKFSNSSSWRTSTWKWDWKNPFTIWGSDLSLCASRGGHYQFKMCYDFCFCCWFRRKVLS